MTIPSKLIWQTITSLYLEIKENGETKNIKNPDVLPGEPIPAKRLSYDSEEFGIISQKEVIEIMMQVFGAKSSRDKEKRSITFDKVKLDRLSKMYEPVTDMTDMTDIGLDKHILKPETQAKNERKIPVETKKLAPVTMENASQASQASPDNSY